MDALAKSMELSNWLSEKVDGVDVLGDERSRVAASCFDVAIEHHSAVTLLCERRLFGSAFALARSVVEAYVRGLWLGQCATDTQLQTFLREKLKKDFGQLIAEVEELEAYSGGELSRSKSSTWKLLNSFTHTGFNQIVRRSSAASIESNYEQEDVEEVLRFVDSYALLAGLEVAKLAHQRSEALLGQFLEQAKQLGSAGSANAS